MAHPPLIVFDSGIGGFSILHELTQFDTPLYYYADQANFPYGTKTETWLRYRFAALAEHFAGLNPLGLVVACNTGTVAGIKVFRQKLTCPVFGVEPVTKMLKNHANPVVWGTQVTTTSATAKALQTAHGSHITYYTPEGLATAIEQHDLGGIKTALAQAARALPSVDALGLSCTHYPLIKPLIQAYFPQAQLYDPSPAVAVHVAKSLQLTRAVTPPPITYQSSLSVLRLKRQARQHGL